MNEVNGLITFLSSSLGITLIGWWYQSVRSRKLEKEALQKENDDARDIRLKALEDKVSDMDKSDTKFEGSLKRIHQRIDSMERSQDKLENKIEKDLQDVKKSIGDLTALVIEAIRKGE